MLSEKSSFLLHCKKLKIEGFKLDRLLTECLARGIELRSIRVKNDLEMTLLITEEDYKRLVKIVKSKYKITVLWEKGARPVLNKALAGKATLLGFLIFAGILYYQSLFVDEIRIYGYEAIPEPLIREVMKEAGLYEGCKKDIDVSNIKQVIYSKIPDIAWAGISLRGNLVEVTISEGSGSPPPLPDKTPCNIVAAQAGYVSEIIPREGLRTVADGTYVNVGDILITGTVPISSTAYGTSAVSITERYVHADGEVRAITPHRLIFYQERNELIKNKTGRQAYGICFQVGDHSIDTQHLTNRYEVSVKTTKKIMDVLRPFPIKITFSRAEEVKLTKKERTEEEMERLAAAQLRTYMKENFSEKAQIVNKSLNFTTKKNIIEVSIMLEVLQEIGREQEIVFGEFIGQTE